MKNHDTKYAIIIFITIFQRYKKKKIKPYLILMIMEKICKNTKRGKNINCKAIFKNFERVNKKDMILPIMLKNLEEFYLYIDENLLF